MFGRGGDDTSPDSSGETAGREPIGALRERLDDGERIHYRLEGAGPLVHERDGDSERMPDEAAMGTLAALTDRRLCFAAFGESGVEVDEVSYRDVRSATATGGLLGSELTVRVWNRGTYRLSTDRGADTEGAAAFVERASGTYQRVLAALESAREEITDLGTHVEAGDADAIADSHEAIRDDLAVARRRIEAGPAAVRAVLDRRVSTVATELQRTRMRAHLARASTLGERGDDLTDREAWDEAVTAYTRAADHLETARDVSTAQGFGLGDAIERESERLQGRVDRLAGLPLRLAEDARAAAQGTGDIEQAVPAWAAAVEHYRAAATAGWGTWIDFEGETGALRMQVEWAAANLIEGRRELAARLRREGDDHRMAGDDAEARDRYEAALSQLSAADRVASELRAGDVAAIAEQRDAVRERLVAVRPTRDVDDGTGGPPDGRCAPARRPTPVETDSSGPA